MSPHPTWSTVGAELLLAADSVRGHAGIRVRSVDAKNSNTRLPLIVEMLGLVGVLAFAVYWIRTKRA